MAFACRPSVIVLDEPTTGLDVSTQAHVLDTVRRPVPQHEVAALYVTHDLAVVANLADRVAVMYAGRIVEEGPTAAIFSNPAHPYTRHLVAAAPDMTASARWSASLAEPGAGRSTDRLLRSPIGASWSTTPVWRSCRRWPRWAPADRAMHPIRSRSRSGSSTCAAESSAIAASARHALMVRDVSASYTRSSGRPRRRSSTSSAANVSRWSANPGPARPTLSRSIGGLHREWTGEILLGRCRARAVGA